MYNNFTKKLISIISMTSLMLLCSESKTGKSKDVNIPDSQVVKMAVTDSGNDQQINESSIGVSDNPAEEAVTDTVLVNKEDDCTAEMLVSTVQSQTSIDSNSIMPLEKGSSGYKVLPVTKIVSLKNSEISKEELKQYLLKNNKASDLTNYGYGQWSITFCRNTLC